MLFLSWWFWGLYIPYTVSWFHCVILYGSVSHVYFKALHTYSLTLNHTIKLFCSPLYIFVLSSQFQSI
jgi:hypothetical protein